MTPTIVLISAFLFWSFWVSSYLLFFAKQFQTWKELSFHSFHTLSSNLFLLEKQRTQRYIK